MCPIQGYFDVPFASSGDKTAVPDDVQGNGSVSYTSGYGILYSTAVASGGYNFPRAQHNQVLFDITSALQYLQQNGAPPFISTTMNGGSPYSYRQGAIVSYNNGTNTQNYLSLVANNVTLPTSGSWVPLGTTIAGVIFSGGTTTGSANAQATTTTQGGCTVTTAGTVVTAKAGITNTTAATLNTDASAAITIKKNSASGLVDLAANDIVANNEYMFISNGTNWILLNPSTITSTRTKLSTNTTFYVATTGNDSNPGTVGSPWLTLQHAYDYIAANIDISGFTCIVSVGDGTYAAGVAALVPTTGGFITFQGNLTTPGNCILSTGGNPCIGAYNGCTINAGGFKVTGSSYLVQARGSGANITLNGKMEYGTGGTSLLAHINAFWGGFVEVTADYTISGNVGQHLYCSGATLRISGVTITLTGTPVFSGQFALASDSGRMEIFPNTYTGSGSGTAYLANANGVINTNGNGLPSGLSGGSTASGGQYI